MERVTAVEGEPESTETVEVTVLTGFADDVIVLERVAVTVDLGGCLAERIGRLVCVVVVVERTVAAGGDGLEAVELMRVTLSADFAGEETVWERVVVTVD